MTQSIKKNYYAGDEVDVFSKFRYGQEKWVVINHCGNFEAIRSIDLRKTSYKEETKQRYEADIKKLEEKKMALVKKIQDKAIETLAFRVRLNSIMTKDNEITSTGIAVADQIQKLIEQTTVGDLLKEDEKNA